MNEAEATRLLDRLGSDIAVGAAPTERVTDAGRRRLRARRTLQLAGVASAIAVMTVGGAVLSSDLEASPIPTAPAATGSDQTPPDGHPTGTPGLPGRPPTSEDLLGTWRPIVLQGHDVSAIRRSAGSALVLSFRPFPPGTGWEGYDGCNWTSGQVHLGPGGGFSAVEGVTTARGCITRDGSLFAIPGEPFTIVDAVTQAAQARLNGGRLTFYDNARSLLGTFIRA